MHRIPHAKPTAHLTFCFKIVEFQLHQQQSSSTSFFKMAPSNLPAIFNPTKEDVEMLLAAQTHLGSKNLQVHMEPYLWKTRADGINIINISKTW
jgi:hypothetical protein